MAGTITVKPGETLQIVGVPADSQLPPYIWGPTDPRPTPPIAGPGRPPNWGMANDPNYGIEVGGGGGNLPVDPGYSPPWAQVPGGGQGGGPVDPGYSPPWAQIPEGEDKGTWCWGYSPQQKRWMWVRVPGEGEAGPK